MPFLKYTRLKLKLRVFLAGHSVAMITYCVTKIIPMCSPVIGQFFDTLIKSSYNDTSKSKSWNKYLQRSRNFVKSLNWLEADNLALYKEKEEFELRTSGLQDQAFSTAQIQINHLTNLREVYFCFGTNNSLFPAFHRGQSPGDET